MLVRPELSRVAMEFKTEVLHWSCSRFKNAPVQAYLEAGLEIHVTAISCTSTVRKNGVENKVLRSTWVKNYLLVNYL